VFNMSSRILPGRLGTHGKLISLTSAVILISVAIPPQAESSSIEPRQEPFYLAQVNNTRTHMVVDNLCSDEELIWALEHAEYRHQRRMAAELLGDREVKEALPNLLRALKDPEEVVQKGVAEALTEIGDDTIFEELIEDTRDPNPRVREYSIYILGRLGTKGDRDIIEAIENLTDDEDKNVRVEAIYALYEFGANSSKDFFIEGLEDEEPRVRMHSATALGNLKSPGAARALALALELEPDEDVRRIIASALGKLGSNYAVDALVDVLPFETESVRADIAVKLGEVKSPQAIRTLTELLLSDPSSNVRSKAAIALLNAKDHSTTPALATALKDRVAIVRRPVSEALIYLADISILDDLIDALADPDSTVADNAAEALIRLNELETVHSLIRILDSPNRIQVERAIKVLGETTQRPYGSNIKKWKEWYEESFNTDA